MNTRTAKRTTKRLRTGAATGVGAFVGLWVALLMSASSSATVSSQTELDSFADPVSRSTTLPPDISKVAVIDPVSAADADAVGPSRTALASLEAPSVAAGQGAPFSRALLGAGWLLAAGALSLAAVNSRKRPLRWMTARTNRDG